MQKMYNPARIAVIFIVLAAMIALYLTDLYRIQIHEALAFDPDAVPARVHSRTVNLPAARGNIYDRNGILLASGRPSFNIMLDRNTMGAQGIAVMNETILELIYATMEYGFAHVDTFPVTRGAPFTFLSDMTNEQRRRIEAYFDFHNLSPYKTASELLAWMRGHYNIDYTIGILDARLIIGVRWEMEMRLIIGHLGPYVFARDVTTDFITLLSERGYAGVFEESSFIREYHTTYAAHVLGYIRRMSPEQFERLREYGYAMDALVGQVGAEYAFESQLRGIDGRKRVRSTGDGTIVDVAMIREPQPGEHVYLTIDIDLQIVVEHALRTQIDIINQQRAVEARFSGEEIDLEEITIPGGAVVVLDVRTGELLAAASYPTFNPITLSQDFAMLNLDPRRPMFNRATHGRFVPGSTFKMVTGFAGLRYGIVTEHTGINCVGRFTRLWHPDPVRSFVANCWIFNVVGVGHHTLGMVSALEVSCNYYFMEIAARHPTGWLDASNMIARTARDFGLGVSTGIELPENTGRLDSSEWRREQYDLGLRSSPTWHQATTVVTAFGQGENRFTPLQLASYTATIANGGTLFEQSVLSRVVSSDFSEQTHRFEPTIRSVIEETEHIELIREGMLQASRGTQGTARSVFRDYPIRVGSKTGTAQFDTRDVNDGVFVAYAPHNNPEIAVAIVVEKGGSGSAIMDIARMIFDYYFSTGSASTAVPYGQLIP
ncbi:MAG: penicillin-binding transpeptidase domain-containing protein [Oscillospiraceae bacterium]|nr:penicillin-binding transpeptidase domain-containing protein [Oscillospiraceae bacterium]